MAIINKLPKHMADLIAAGEVVERPASVVKELLENAVDAGADAVTVEIQNGGISYIRVTDNGCGISKDDIKTAFQSHATSKIKSADDLNKIMTLGFRGEALPSIAAVSKTTVISKTRDELIGNTYTIEGGVETDFSEAGCSDGTTMIVRSLFFNTPARMKFLKKDSTEGSYVSSVVTKLALSYPHISFRFIKDGKQVFTTNGDGNLNNICFGAFGKDFSNGLINVDGEQNSIRVKGLITPPFNCRGSRGMQYIFVNGRSVRNTTIISALEAAYKNSVMVGKFPGCVLFIDLPPQLVDVNVHPSKIEVRFSDERSIFDAVYNACKTAITKADSIKNASFNVKGSSNLDELLQRPYEQVVQTRIQPDYNTVENKKTAMQYVNDSPAFVSDVTDNYSAEDDDNGITIQFPVVNLGVESKKTEEAIITEDINEESFRLIGEAYKTYIFLELNGTLCVIDKHAAHERILFNKLKNQNNNTGSQILMVPQTVSLDKEEYSAVVENLEVISKAGFDIQDFGDGTVIVRSCPIDLDNCEVSTLIGEIADRLRKNKRDITNEHLDWIYHNVACRGAIKAGDSNSYEELYQLCKDVIYDKNVRYCPHGRPVMIEISKYELEKQFGRV